MLGGAANGAAIKHASWPRSASKTWSSTELRLFAGCQSQGQTAREPERGDVRATNNNRADDAVAVTEQAVWLPDRSSNEHHTLVSFEP